ncbi:phage tail tape measure protein [bacterium]|nr:phage tail tape measure protein [bacterium]
MAQDIKLSLTMLLKDGVSEPLNVMTYAANSMANGVTSSINKVNNAFSGLGDYAKKMREQFQGLEVMKNTGADIAAFGKNILSVFERPVSAMARMEGGMAQLKSKMLQANGEVAASYDDLSKEIIKVANVMPATADEMYRAAAGAVAQGLDPEALTKGGLKSAAEFAVGVLGNDYGRALQYAAAISRTWGVDQANLGGNGGIYDLLARSSNLGVSVDDMVTMIAKTGASAGALGQSGFEALSQRIPYFAMLRRQLAGSSADTLSTNLAKLESRVMDQKSVAAANAMLPRGQRLQFVDQTGRYLGFENLVTQIEKLNDSRISDEKRAAIIGKVFGELPEIKSLVAVLMKSGNAGAAQTRAEIEGQASLAAQTSLQLGTFSGKWNAFMGTLDSSMGIIGGLYTDELQRFADMLTDIAAWIGKIAEENPTLIRFFTITTGGVGLLAVAAGNFLQVMANLAMALPIMKTAVTWLIAHRAAMWTHTLATMASAGKILLAMAPMAVIIAGAVAWYKVFSALGDVTTDVGQDFAVLTSGLEGLKAVLSKIGGFFSYIIHGGEVTEAAAKASLRVDELASSNVKIQRDKAAMEAKKAGDNFTYYNTINIDAKNKDMKQVMREIEMIQKREGRYRYQGS